MPSKTTPTVLTCACGKQQVIKCVASRDYSKWQCRSCAIAMKWKDPSYIIAQKANTKNQGKRSKLTKQHRNKISTSMRLRWNDSAYHERMKSRKLTDKQKDNLSKSLKGRKLTTDHKMNLSQSVQKRWAENDEYRDTIIKQLRSKERRDRNCAITKKRMSQEGNLAVYRTETHRQKMSSVSKSLWEQAEYREKIKKAKSTAEFKAKMATIQRSDEYKTKLAVAAQNQPKVSKIQQRLYSILDDLEIPYFREYNNKQDDPQCRIGPWTFDCVVPRPGKRTLLVECHGNYIHSLPHKRLADKQKATYVERYCPNHELKVIWEHEFATKRAAETIKYWVGISEIERVEFELTNVMVRRAAAADYKPLLETYHYLASAGRGGLAYCGYLDTVPIATAIFSPLPRQNITINSIPPNQIRDLSRLCIHPKYQNHNFGSWFISRCIRLLPVEYTAIVAYSDTTYNHTGSVYKASNFKLHRICKPEYWYADSNGWVMHKKTLYNKAQNLKLTESEFATRYGYVKTIGKNKHLYLLIR